MAEWMYAHPVDHDPQVPDGVFAVNADHLVKIEIYEDRITGVLTDGTTVVLEPQPDEPPTPNQIVRDAEATLVDFGRLPERPTPAESNVLTSF